MLFLSLSASGLCQNNFLPSEIPHCEEIEKSLWAVRKTDLSWKPNEKWEEKWENKNYPKYRQKANLIMISDL